MELDRNQHSVYLLNYHLVMVIKYRRKVITDEVSEYLKHQFVRVGEFYGVTLQEWNHDVDHVHVLFRATPHTEITKFLNAYKSSSSRMVKKKFPEITQYLWKSAFWTQSYCLISTGGAPLEVVKKYIENQGIK
ncbi:IS200/IS605 family transposase [Limosilactobacillus ingluviei]|uniref:IS200/IS605 family transposase n=1 Tax=Limosilactobacillus ingluviei TaxID=148604 RepID=UPI000704E7C7|nr:IS200/IS605 family transposase [Limosilactobacillus ingluviei]